MFGSLWLKRWEDCPLDMVKRGWTAELERFDDWQVRQALQALKTSGAEFPPTLPQFIALCISFKRTNAPRLRLVAPREPPPAGAFEQLRNVIARAPMPTPDDEIGK
jgi:hypothetical protein